MVDGGFRLVSKSVWDDGNLYDTTGDSTTPRTVEAGLRNDDDTPSGVQKLPDPVMEMEVSDTIRNARLQ